MLEKYLVIPADINIPVYFVSVNGDSDYSFNDVVHREIDCDCFEHVRINNHLNFSFLVDECGKLKNPSKPVNLRVSFFYPGTFFGDPIVGNVFVCDIGVVDGECDFIPISEYTERKILEIVKFLTE